MTDFNFGEKFENPLTSLQPSILPSINTNLTPSGGVATPTPAATLQVVNGQTLLTSGVLQSPNFKKGEVGWGFDAEGNLEANSGTFRGTITATTGAIGGFTIGADNLKDLADSFGLASTVTGGNDVRFWAGGTYANRASANLRIYESGNINIDYGADLTLIQGGNIKFTSVTAPTACTAALITTAGNVDIGTHRYKITYVNTAGETELGATSNVVTNDASNQQNSLTSIPVSTSNSVTARKIYRTKAGGSVVYYLLTTIADNTTTTYTDNTSDANLDIVALSERTNTTFGKIIINSIVVASLGNSNAFLGQNTGLNNTIGINNTAIGNNSLKVNTSGGQNVALGQNSLLANTIGGYNTALGALSLYYNIDGNFNTAVGVFASLANTTGQYNTAIGAYSLSGLNQTGSNNVCIGYFAGYYEVDSNKFYVNNEDRTNTAGDKSKSLLYGEFNTQATAQKLKINADLVVGAMNYAADAQASDTYVITLTLIPSSLRTGMIVVFKANTANTDAATLNVNGLGAKTIVKGVNTTLANNDILAAMFCLVVYNGTNFVLMNPRTL